MLHHGTPSIPNHSPNWVRLTGRSTTPRCLIASASALRPGREPWPSPGEDGRARSSAAIVRGPQMPSTSSPCSAWKTRSGGRGGDAVAAVQRPGRVAERRQRLLQVQHVLPAQQRADDVQGACDAARSEHAGDVGSREDHARWSREPGLLIRGANAVYRAARHDALHHWRAPRRTQDRWRAPYAAGRAP